MNNSHMYTSNNNNNIYSDQRGTYFKTSKSYKAQYTNHVPEIIINAIVDCINSWINPALNMHDGLCNLINSYYSKGRSELTIVIEYEGKCSHCSSSTNETLAMIKETITEELATSGLFRGKLIIRNTSDIGSNHELLPYDLLD